ASTFRVFGTSEASARLVPALSGAILVLAVCLLAARLGYRSTGWWVASLVGLNYVLTHFSRFAMTESTYLLFLFVAFAAFLQSLSERRRFWIVLSGLAFGLSAMTKGVVALVFPLAGLLFSLLLMPWIPWCTRARRALPGSGIALANLAIASAVGVLVAAPWHVYMVLTQGMPFIHDYFLWNVWERIVSGVDMQKKALGSLYYMNQLPIRMPFGFMLFLLSLARTAGCIQLASLFRIPRAARSRKEVLNDHPSLPEQRREIAKLLFFSWIGVALAAFSVAQSKLVQYTPPMVLPALLLAGLEADRLWRHRSWQRGDLLVLITPVVLLWAALAPWRLAVKRIAGAAIPSPPDFALSASVLVVAGLITWS
ncbi:MAG: phospholipid carrier-dependent glycosyltransferase, partial [Candidatus Eisenbacteria bacterium]